MLHDVSMLRQINCNALRSNINILGSRQVGEKSRKNKQNQSSSLKCLLTSTSWCWGSLAPHLIGIYMNIYIIPGDFFFSLPPIMSQGLSHWPAGYSTPSFSVFQQGSSVDYDDSNSETPHCHHPRAPLHPASPIIRETFFSREKKKLLAFHYPLPSIHLVDFRTNIGFIHVSCMVYLRDI